MDESTRGASHWRQHASVWELLGPPLRPCSDDVDAVRSRLAGRLEGSPRVLLLGATPELASMAWGRGTELVAVDRSRAVMDNVFPTSGVPERTSCVEAEWSNLPFEGDRFDVVLGDGALTCLEFPAGYRSLARELRRVTYAGADIVMRIFAALDRAETLETIADELERGAVGSLHVLKWRIAMALQGSARSVAVADILAAFERMVPDWPSTAAARGWPVELIRTIEPYRESKARYSFPTADEVRDCLGPDLAWIDATFRAYELGDRCVTVHLRSR